MANFGKITHIKKQFSPDTHTLGSTFSEKGYNRSPGTMVYITPYKEATGEYRTGLDENAKYINKLPKEEREIEKQRVREYAEIVRNSLGDDFDVAGRSAFYREIYHPDKFNTREVCPKAKLSDGDNLFNLEDPYDLITFAYLRVHPQFVAKSYDDITRGLARDTVKFYVNDQDYETKQVYKETAEINKAIVIMSEMIPSDRIRIARLLGINISYTSSEEVVYTELDKFIKTTQHISGDKLHNTKLFLKFAKMEASDLKIRFIIDQAFSFNILRSIKGRIMDGGNEIAKTKEELIELYSKAKYQKDLDALETRVAALKVAEI